MDNFDRTWLIVTIVTALAVLLIDEAAFYLWRKLNPGTMFTPLLKHPTTIWTPPENNYPNGFRPAGGI